mgnify:CR=1 FL=1
MIIYKALSKAELAQDANITPSQLRRWLKECHNEMTQLGVTPKTKILPPSAVGLLARKYQFLPRNIKVIPD